MQKEIVIVGGGASGVFTAINLGRLLPQHLYKITVLESSHKALQKLKMSGGGRCNVTHNCFDIPVLLKNYPRGHKKLKKLFYDFGPTQTIEWFQQRGVTLKAEGDGRIFPTTNDSQTIIDCFLNEAKKYNIQILYKHLVKDITQENEQFSLHIKNHEEPIVADYLILATGSAPLGHQLASKLGHKITPLAPSLFTFKIQDPRIMGLQGVSFSNVLLSLKVNQKKFQQEGPLLITHWGLSGPGVLKLSAWGARELKSEKYSANLSINFFPKLSQVESWELLSQHAENHRLKKVENSGIENIPKRYWKSLLESMEYQNATWQDLKAKTLRKLHNEMTNAQFLVSGKGIFKEEFVTCGGVCLSEIQLKSMESSKSKNLFFAGEITDVDGITGGFNFQFAWASSMKIAKTLSQKLNSK